jgi:hypothetical protein
VTKKRPLNYSFFRPPTFGLSGCGIHSSQNSWWRVGYIPPRKPYIKNSLHPVENLLFQTDIRVRGKVSKNWGRNQKSG